MKRRENAAREEKTSSRNRISASFKVGAVALAFLTIGFQSALFIRRAAVLRIASHRDAPDTVYVVDDALARRVLSDAGLDAAYLDGAIPDAAGQDVAGQGAAGSFDAASSAAAPSSESAPPLGGSSGGRNSASRGSRTRSSASSSSGGRNSASRGSQTGGRGAVIVRRNAPHSSAVEATLPRRVESFPFNPNTVSLSDLMRLGFSEKQAQSIINYREKGGRFRRPSDFAKSFVVADSVFRRLEPFIRIPKVDLNAADSAALDALPGIGPYYAARIIEHRTKLQGFSYPEQLMDIYRFDQERFDALKDLITVGPSEPYPLWTLPEEELEKHPYIGRYGAHGVVLYRDNNPRGLWTVAALRAAGALRPEDADRLARCRLAAPDSTHNSSTDI